MLAAWKDVPDESPDAASPEDVPPTIDSTPGTAASPDEETFAVTGDIAPTAPAGEPRRAVPPDAKDTTSRPGRGTRRRALANSRRLSEEQLPRRDPSAGQFSRFRDRQCG